MNGIIDSVSDNLAETALLYIHPQTPPPVVPITGGGEGVEKIRGVAIMQMILVGRQYFDYIGQDGKQVQALRLYLSYDQPGQKYDGMLVSDLYVSRSTRPDFYDYCLNMELGKVYEPELTFNPQKNTSYIIGFIESTPINISADEIQQSFEKKK